MRRIVLWVMSTITALVLLFGYHTSTSSAMAAGGSSSVVTPLGGTTGSSSEGVPAPSTSTSASPTASAVPSATRSTSAAKTVTGAVADTRWGPVQVQLTVQDKRITDVNVVEYPNNNPRDQEINSQALPILVQETLSAQSATIDMVSGATVTSDGYLQSLQSALDQAGM